jgi:hypothetical protein
MYKKFPETAQLKKYIRKNVKFYYLITSVKKRRVPVSMVARKKNICEQAVLLVFISCSLQFIFIFWAAVF